MQFSEIVKSLWELCREACDEACNDKCVIHLLIRQANRTRLCIFLRGHESDVV